MFSPKKLSRKNRIIIGSTIAGISLVSILIISVSTGLFNPRRDLAIETKGTYLNQEEVNNIVEAIVNDRIDYFWKYSSYLVSEYDFIKGQNFEFTTASLDFYARYAISPPESFTITGLIQREEYIKGTDYRLDFIIMDARVQTVSCCAFDFFDDVYFQQFVYVESERNMALLNDTYQIKNKLEDSFIIFRDVEIKRFYTIVSGILYTDPIYWEGYGHTPYYESIVNLDDLNTGTYPVESAITKNDMVLFFFGESSYLGFLDAFDVDKAITSGYFARYTEIKPFTEAITFTISEEPVITII